MPHVTALQESGKGSRRVEKDYKGFAIPAALPARTHHSIFKIKFLESLFKHGEVTAMSSASLYTDLPHVAPQRLSLFLGLPITCLIAVRSP